MVKCRVLIVVYSYTTILRINLLCYFCRILSVQSFGVSLRVFLWGVSMGLSASLISLIGHYFNQLLCSHFQLCCGLTRIQYFYPPVFCFIWFVNCQSFRLKASISFWIKREMQLFVLRSSLIYAIVYQKLAGDSAPFFLFLFLL